MSDTTGTGYSTTDWARQNGTHYRYSIALDNYEPTRDFAYGDCWQYDSGTELRFVLDGAITLRDGTQSVYLLDDGARVIPHYVIAYHPEKSHVILGQFPVNVREDGTPILREDNGLLVNFDGWFLGPQRAYHVKIRRAENAS